MIAIKKQIGVLKENIFLLKGIVKDTFKNKIVIVTAGSSFVFAVGRNSRNDDVNHKNDPIIRNEF